MVKQNNESTNGEQIIKPVAIDHWPRGITCDGGFRILGTPIGFGASSGASLSFIDGVDETPRRKGRILLTQFAAAALGVNQKRLDAMELGYDRTIRLGRIDIRLFPSGMGLGSAQLELSFRGRHIIYCGGIRHSPPLCAPSAEFPKCDLLLLDAPAADPKPPSPARVAAKLNKWAKFVIALGKVPVFACAGRAAALDVLWTLGKLDEPVRISRPLFEMMRRVKVVGFPAPSVALRLEQAFPKEGLVVDSAQAAATGKYAAQEASVAFVGPGRDCPPWAETNFRMAESEDRPGLISYVKETHAKAVALGPSCDEEILKALQKTDVEVYRVQNLKQIPLPFD